MAQKISDIGTEVSRDERKRLRQERWRKEAIVEKCEMMAECIFRDTCTKVLIMKTLQDLPLGQTLSDQIPMGDLKKTCKELAEVFFAEELESLMEHVYDVSGTLEEKT